MSDRKTSDAPGEASRKSRADPNAWLDRVTSFGIGLGNGAIGLAGFPGDLRSLASAGTDDLGRRLGIDPARVEAFKNLAASSLKYSALAPLLQLPTSAEIYGGIEKLAGEFSRPKPDPAGERDDGLVAAMVRAREQLGPLTPPPDLRSPAFREALIRALTGGPTGAPRPQPPHEQP